MGFKCGIVGLPNVGKSTLFNALTKAGIQAANFPFCTIEPNVGIVPVPDARMTQLSEIVKPQKTISTAMEFVDIAGLVAGASKGEGLGNQFLATIRETDAIVHVVRCFDHSDIIHVAGKVDPISDVETIQTELLLADLDCVEKAHNKAQKQSKSGGREAAMMLDTLGALKAHLEQGHLVSSFEADAEVQKVVIKPLQLLTGKPVLYLANVDEQGFENNPHLDKLKARADKEGAQVVAICAELESQLVHLDPEEAKAFLEDLKLNEPGLNRLIRAGYRLLNLQTYFTAGVKEVRAWTIPVGAKAPEAAGKIHTDFEKGFIRAEVIAFDDFIKYRGEAGAKEAGRLRLECKEYVVQDGDVVHFRFNV